MAAPSQLNQPVASSQPETQIEPGLSLRQGLRNSSLSQICSLPHSWGLGLILLLGAFLRFYRLGAAGVGNSYYAATVQSMLLSWHNFIFAAFEPGGSITVDKPPLGFWVQAASARIFGVNGFALALPQAAAGTLSILVLFFLVKRHFGFAAGLAAALALAVTPVAVATERNNTIDGLLVFVLLLAAWAVQEAVEQGKFRYLLLGAFLVGIGFNIKMLQAYMIMPALYLVYLLGSRERWANRLLHLALASAVLLAVSFSWAVAVDLTPAGQRPYIGSSQDNTVLGLITGHNGLSRLIGGPGAAQPNGLQPPLSTGNSDSFQRPPVSPPWRGQGAPFPAPGGGPGIPQGGRLAEVGQPGWLRLFSQPLDIETSWLLPLALAGLPLVLALLGWRRGASRERQPMTGRHLDLMMWGVWLLAEMAYFTFTNGLFHAYYLIMLGPPLAALVGAAVWSMWQVQKRRRWPGWVLAALLSGITLGYQTSILTRYPQIGKWILTIAVLVWLAGLIWLAVAPAITGSARPGKAALGLVCLSLVAGPLAWSGMTTFNTAPDMMLPRSGPLARPGLADRAGSQAPRDGNASNAPQTGMLDPNGKILLDYLLANTPPGSYLVATLNARQASPFILAALRPVLTLGGFTGSDHVVSVEDLALMIESGELRFILGEPEMERQKPVIFAWIRQNCTPVQAPGLKHEDGMRTQPPRPGGNLEAAILFDCQGFSRSESKNTAQ